MESFVVRVRKLKNSNINVGISKYHQYLTSFTIAIVTKDHESKFLCLPKKRTRLRNAASKDVPILPRRNNMVVVLLSWCNEETMQPY